MHAQTPDDLIVREIYRTILGESTEAGRPCAIVRLTGCHRRCSYCDSAHAFEGGESLAVARILAAVAALGCRTVLVTGGEPLLQPGCPALLAALVGDGRRTVLETSGTLGALPLSAVPGGVRRVVDVKTPGSGLRERDVAWDQLACLDVGDELKFVCCDRADYEWSRELVRAGNRLPPATPVVFSAAEGRLSPASLADWLVEDGLDVRFQLQLHKTLWPDGERRT